MADLRSWLDEYSDQVKTISEEIDSKFEIQSYYLETLKKQDTSILIFKNPLNALGQPSAFPVITNVFGSRERCAESIKINPNKAAVEYTERSRKRRDPVVVDSKDAPVKQVVKKGAEVNLLEFPAVWHHESDPGHYITAGYVTTTDPEEGIDNCALQRCWIKGPQKMGLLPNTGSHNRLNIERYWEQGKGCPVAIWLGHHAGVCVGGQVKLSYPASHYEAMGGLIDEPLRLVPSETYGNELMVPADAEIVIEGIIPPYEFEAEGPFGEFTRHIGPQVPNPVIHVTAVTHRKDAMWHDIMVGYPDNQIMGGFAVEARTYNICKSVVPTVLDVYAPLSGCCRFISYIKIKKTEPGLGKTAAMAALTSQRCMKYAYVVDEDVDIYNEAEVMWVFATRSQLDKDLIVVPNCPATNLDPSAPIGDMGTKAGFDCTRPAPLGAGLPKPFHDTLRVPAEVVTRVKQKFGF